MHDSDIRDAIAVLAHECRATREAVAVLFDQINALIRGATAQAEVGAQLYAGLEGIAAALSATLQHQAALSAVLMRASGASIH